MQQHSTKVSGGGVALRLYAALAVTDDAAAQLHDWAETVAAGRDDLRVGDRDDLHVTFAFLGDVVEEYVPVVAAALDAAAFSIPGPTAAIVDGVDRFGSGRVLGVDVELELHAMLDVARDRFLDALLPYAPHADRRAWRPHASLVRTRGDAQLPTHEALAAHPLGRVDWVIPDLRLYASLPGPDGTLHRQLHAVPLGEPVLHD